MKLIRVCYADGHVAYLTKAEYLKWKKERGN